MNELLVILQKNWKQCVFLILASLFIFTACDAADVWDQITTILTAPDDWHWALKVLFYVGFWPLAWAVIAVLAIFCMFVAPIVLIVSGVIALIVGIITNIQGC